MAKESPRFSPGDVEEIRVDIVEGHGTLRKIILKSGKIIVLETEEGVVEVLEAIRSGKAIKDALKGARKYRPYRLE